MSHPAVFLFNCFYKKLCTILMLKSLTRCFYKLYNQKMEKLNNKKMSARKIFKILMWAFLILFTVYVVLVAIRIPHVIKKQKTQDQIVRIHNTKLKIEDVEGKNLPPDPGVNADKTLQGVDANNNGIRDDVELAIFKQYPNSAKTRAVLLQYALTSQMIFTQPFVNEEIATEVIREQDRGFQCVGNIIPDRGSDVAYNKLTDFISFVEKKQFDTDQRVKAKDNFFDKVRSYSSLNNLCDIDLTKLFN